MPKAAEPQRRGIERGRHWISSRRKVAFRSAKGRSCNQARTGRETIDRHLTADDHELGLNVKQPCRDRRRRSFAERKTTMRPSTQPGRAVTKSFVNKDCTRCAHGAEKLRSKTIGYARRAARARWPPERMLMEVISCAFQPVETRAADGWPVPQIQIDRLVFVLDRYLAHVGSPWSEDERYEAVERFIRTCPRRDPDDVAVGTEPSVEPGAEADSARGDACSRATAFAWRIGALSLSMTRKTHP
jgi:hypothetical protein